jgi:hypothetical protein
LGYVIFYLVLILLVYFFKLIFLFNVTLQSIFFIPSFC